MDTPFDKKIKSFVKKSANFQKSHKKGLKEIENKKIKLIKQHNLKLKKFEKELVSWAKKNRVPISSHKEKHKGITITFDLNYPCREYLRRGRYFCFLVRRDEVLPIQAIPPDPYSRNYTPPTVICKYRCIPSRTERIRRLLRH